jgi:glutamyl-tRNA reductase
VIFNLARKKIKDFSKAQVLLIGAGETVNSIAQVLTSHRVKDICIANRTVSKAKNIAEKLNARICALSKIDLSNADIVISAISGTQSVFDKNEVVQALKQRKQKPILFFDLGVPRNMDPEINKIKNVVLFCFDDLKEILDENRGKRLGSVRAAEKMIDLQTKQFIRNLRSLSVSDAIKKYRHKMNSIRDEYLKKSIQALLIGEDPEKVIKKLGYQLTNKFLHAPTVNLKKAACQEDWVLVHTVEKLWDL